MTNFNAQKECERIIEFIRNYYKEHHLGGVVIGISGGKDSAVVAALMVKALGKENVLGLTLPCHSKEEDKTDALLISKYYGFEMVNIDLTSTYDEFKKQINLLGNFTDQEIINSDINLKPRLRMASLYYMAALYSALKGKTYLVTGTSNKCELFVGYFTKGGDSVHDISPIADLTVAEVIALGEVLDVPAKVLYKKPNDGLSNQTDEDKLGVSYKDIANYMEEPKKLDEKIALRIRKLHEANLHKFNIPTYYKTKG